MQSTIIRRSQWFQAAVVLLVVLVYFEMGTKYTSLRLTTLDAELQSLKTIEMTSASNTSTTPHKNNQDCFWYSDNLYHLLCAVLTDRPILFHAIANRVPQMHKDLFRYLDVTRCSLDKRGNKETSHRSAGWEDLEQNKLLVQTKLQILQRSCVAESSTKEKQIDFYKSNKTCLHLARNFNRRLQNCSLDLCDTIVFDDSLAFCNLWNIVQNYDTIVSPHGFQLALPIIAHAARQSRLPSRLHVIEVRWPGYGDRSYQELTRIFDGKQKAVMNHTLIYGYTPQGKLNEADNTCVRNKACRKTERRRDLYCSATTQQQLTDAIFTFD